MWFVCSICGSAANLVQVLAIGKNINIIGSGYLGKVEFNHSQKDMPSLIGVIMSGDPKVVHDYDLEFVPCYRPTCDALYCEGHWHHCVKFDEAELWWRDLVQGICPHGHRRMLED